MKRIITVFLIILSLFLTVSCTKSTTSDNLSVHCFNAGAADCFVIKAGDECVMIDTALGSFSDEIVSYLRENSINKIDYLIITHFDKDHVGGAAKIIKNTEIGTIIQTDYVKGDTKKYNNYIFEAERAGISPLTPTDIYTFSCDSAEFTIYPPKKAEYEKSPSNNSSLIVSVEYGENKFLFCGDAEDERLSEFLTDNAGNYDFVKMPHHGRIGKMTGALISTVSPRYAVITSSEEEPESSQTLELLKSSGVETFLTKNGNVDVVSDGKILSVSYH